MSEPVSVPDAGKQFFKIYDAENVIKASTCIQHTYLCIGAATTQTANGELGSRPGSPSASQETLTLRALVGTKDAGIIIGKGGKNVADLREQTGVKAGVSKVVTGVHERVLSVSGSVQGVSKVCKLFIYTVYIFIIGK